MTDAEFKSTFDAILGRGLIFCAFAGVACLVAFTSSCCGRVIIP